MKIDRIQWSTETRKGASQIQEMIAKTFDLEILGQVEFEAKRGGLIFQIYYTLIDTGGEIIADVLVNKNCENLSMIKEWIENTFDLAKEEWEHKHPSIPFPSKQSIRPEYLHSLIVTRRTNLEQNF